jgi:putative redox protein
MVRIDVEYRGRLRCVSVHEPSGADLSTDAPKDNQGEGASFSPTDLVATALGSCILTTMAIVANRHAWPLEGATVTVVKHMVADPVRRIGKLEVTLRMPVGLDAKAREVLERTAHTCPVHKSLAPNVEIPMAFHWDAVPAAT